MQRAGEEREVVEVDRSVPIDIRGDELLGIVQPPASTETRPTTDLAPRDVIAFERQHIFGMF